MSASAYVSEPSKVRKRDVYVIVPGTVVIIGSVATRRKRNREHPHLSRQNISKR